MNAVNDTVHEMLDLNHKSSSAHVSATTKKNTPPNQISQGNVQICEMKKKRKAQWPNRSPVNHFQSLNTFAQSCDYTKTFIMRKEKLSPL